MMTVNATYNDEEGGDLSNEIKEEERVPIEFSLEDRNNLQ